MSYRIGSFNVGGPKSLILTDAEAVAEIIKRHRFDIVAFQDMHGNVEVVDSFLRAVCKHLHRFEYRFSRGRSADRSFAFIWSTVTISIVDEPRIYERVYREDRPNATDEWPFKRDPLLGRFMTRNGYEIRLINIHLFFSDMQQRVRECARITGNMYYDIASIVPENIGIKVFTFALGDYNFDCETCNSISRENLFFDIVTTQRDSTTLNKSNASDGGLTSSGLSGNSYDHFTYDKNKVESAIRNPPMAIDAPREEGFSGNYTKYLNEVSDHIPVIIEIF